MRRRGAFLLEQVVTIGMLGLLLLVVASSIIQTGRGGAQSQKIFEAECVAHNLLESQMTRAVSLVPLTPQIPVDGKFRDDTPYQSLVQGYSLGGAGAATGLSDSEIRGVRVTVSWKDQSGQHQAQCEGCVVRIPQ